MDPTSYKDVTTSRGLNYHYYFASAQNSKPTLLFLHGFPSTSYDWRHQVAFFKAKGYGLIVPDMLGYGGTAKPEDPADYVANLIVRDIVDLLDAEAVDSVISISHDWGSKINSRLVNYFPQRVKALAFFAVGYMAPSTKNDFQEHLTMTKKTFGYELFGYWPFFCEDGANKFIESHWDSFYSLCFPHDPKLWRTDMAPLGAMKAWLTTDKHAPSPSYLTVEDKRIQTELLLKDGFSAPLNWYKTVVRGMAAEDDKLVPPDRHDIEHPTFFGGCTRDYICLPVLGQASLAKHCKNATYKEFNADHWVILSHSEVVNIELLLWIEDLMRIANKL